MLLSIFYAVGVLLDIEKVILKIIIVTYIGKAQNQILMPTS